jgi:hypothetical protein
MRFMVIVKASKESEAGVMPTEKEFADMGNYNQGLVDAGAMLAGEGLHPTSRGARVHYDRGKQVVSRGPFPEVEQLVAGYWILQADSLDQVVEWMKKAPFQEGSVEVRQIFEADDFGETYTPELRAQEEGQRAQIAGQHGS